MRSVLPLVLLAISFVHAPARAVDLPCRHEDVLAETAASFLLEGRAPQSAELLPKAQSLGFDGVALHAHEGSDETKLIEWLKVLAERADGPLVCGEASSESRRLVLVAVRGGSLSLKNRVLKGTLEPGFRDPALVLEGKDGEIRQQSTTRQALAQGVALDEGFEPRRVQLLADGASGPRPIAELVLDPDARPRAAPVVMGSADEPRGPRTRSVETMLARIDGFRRQQGASTLRGNDLLTRSAQRHAERVCELGRVAHRFSEGDDPETRLREERIEARAVGEAVARAESADAALSAVFSSPSHRAAVMERKFTDAGVGQALDEKGHTCLVVLLAAWPRRMP